MAHPVVWSPKLFQYPIGNTAATSYIEYLLPEADASILVLGCGDPRNTFYTIQADKAFERALDFTFCDNQPGILARNVLIYTLLHDDCDDQTIQKVWKIYGDIIIDEPSFELVKNQLAQLLDLSTNFEKWTSSKYGNLIKFCTEGSLALVRTYWEQYLQNTERNVNSTKKATLAQMQEISRPYLAQGVITTAMRSAGLLMRELGKMGHDHFVHYWKKGVTDVSASQIDKAIHTNPTLLDREGKLELHYATDPIMCFHLGPALAPVDGTQNTHAKSLDELIAVVKAQFAGWCRAFHKRTTAGTPSRAGVTLRFFAGDAMSLSKALHQCAQGGTVKTKVYANAWGGSTITLTEDYRASSNRAPLSFNAIDTSNLSDHLGLLNTLIVVAPLLKREASATLFTHSLTSVRKEKDSQTSVLQRIGIELPMLCMLLGLVPERASSCSSSQSVCQEIIMGIINRNVSQFLEFNSWRMSHPETPGQAYTFSANAEDLARWLFATYLRIFDDETPEGMLRGMTEIKHNTRETFVRLLGIVKQAYTGSWSDVVHCLIPLIENDTSLVTGLNYYQEFCVFLYLEGLFPIVPPPTMFRPSPRDYCFEGWGPVPKVICVALVVPRPKIQAILDQTKGIQTPLLQCGVGSPGLYNDFASFQPVFGRIEEVSPSPNRKVVIKEDPAGWMGTSDLIVHFVCPAWLLIEKPRSEYKVTFSMYGVAAMAVFASTLGPELCVFSASVADSKRVLILRDRPRVAAQHPPEQAIASLSTIPRAPAAYLPGVTTRQAVDVKFANNEAASFTIRWPVTETKAKSALAIKSTAVSSEATSVATVEVGFDRFHSKLQFPYPIQAGALTTRIARKSSYIEVEARPTKAALKVTADLDPFPVVLQNDIPHALRAHYIFFDTLPALRSPMPPGDDAKWLYLHFQLVAGEQDRQAKLLGTPPDPGPKELRSSIMLMMNKFVVNFKAQPHAFLLSAPEGDGVYSILFFRSLRFDLTAHSVVAEAYVVSLDMAIMMAEGVLDALAVFQRNEKGSIIGTPAEEAKWWKHYLPTAVERCRTWRHGKDCEYVGEGLQGVPRTSEVLGDPICSCGRGRDLAGFDDVKEWKAFRPFVTRAAIGIPYPVALVGHAQA